LRCKTFRVRHLTELGRGDVYSLRDSGLIENSGNDFGRVVDWQLTKTGNEMVTALSVNGVSDVFDEDLVRAVERHPTLVAEDLPDDTDVTFEASDYGFSSSLLAHLHDAGLLEKETERVGEPDEWRVTARALRVRAHLQMADKDAEVEATAEATLSGGLDE
jgi:hypothetical protein